MSIFAVWREYNPFNGNLLGNVSDFNFGNISVGEFGSVRVFDIYVPNVSNISNVKLSISSSNIIPVNPSPTDISSDGSASNGNFGIETYSNFISKNTLTRFFAGLNMPVNIGTRSNGVSNYLYLNTKMAVQNAVSGTVSYKLTFDFS